MQIAISYRHVWTTFLVSHSQSTIQRQKASFSVRPPSRNKGSDDEDYEVINTSEVQVDMNRENEQQIQDDSYIASGTAYMGKFFGYS